VTSSGRMSELVAKPIAVAEWVGFASAQPTLQNPCYDSDQDNAQLGMRGRYAPDHIADVVRDQQRAVGCEGDPDRPSIGLPLVRRQEA